jgi:hypothetical protein
MRRQWQRITAFWSVFVFENRAGISRAHTSGSTGVFGFSVLRSGAFLVCCLALMSFRLMPDDADKNRLVYDVRGAFVAAQPEISHRLMQMVHSYVSESIDVTSRATVRPRVVLTIRLASVKKEPFLLGARSSARVVVRAASVTTGEVIAEARFTAWTRIALRVIWPMALPPGSFRNFSWPSQRRQRWRPHFFQNDFAVGHL